MSHAPLDPAVAHAIRSLPEHLPGEPADTVLHPPAAWRRALDLGLRIVVLAAAVVVTAPVWPVYLLLRAALGRPPHVASTARYLRLLRAAAFGRPSSPGLPGWVRVIVVLAALRRWAQVPWPAFAWWVDELLYGRALDAVVVRAPLIELSAARSGSTQIARYLEDDPSIVAPTVLQTRLPYLWLWRVAGATLGRVVSHAQLEAMAHALFPKPMVERHELDPMRTDTFEVMFFYHHLHDLFSQVGPMDLFVEHSPSASEPGGLWEHEFITFFDRIGRKTLLRTGGERLMIKGHFLAAADALERRYPDARFLTVLRAPEKRLQSTFNYHRYQLAEALLPPIPWAWVVERHLRMEIAYCEQEMAWYGRAVGARRCVVRFDDYVHDLSGTMSKVYRECFDAEVPPHVPTEHGPRVRENYTIDRSLPQCGVDPDWLRARLAGWSAWANGQAATRSAG